MALGWRSVTGWGATTRSGATRGEAAVTRRLRRWAIAGWLLAGLIGATPAFAQKPGGILQMPNFTSPASMSIHEESTIAVGIPMMGAFNNLVVFNQQVAQN